MEGLNPIGGKPTPRLYIPKRSTVLVHCFLLLTLLSMQYVALDGAMEALVTDERMPTLRSHFYRNS
jgi:hypothetical protein